MSRRSSWLAAIVVFAGLRLGAQQPSAGGRSADPAPALTISYFRDSQHGFTQYSGISDSQRVVIRDAGAWRAWWENIHRPFIPAPPAPAVDFTREVIVLAALGARPSGGFTIRIEQATADSARLLLTVRRLVPGTGCAVPAVVTQPLDLVRIPVTTLPIAFVERVERTDCSGPPGTSSPSGDISGIMVPTEASHRRLRTR